MNELSGKVALVTGGSRGIGAAIAQRLAHDGAAVAFTYATAAGQAQAVAKQIDADGGRVLVIQADNADPGAVTGAVEQTAAEFGRLDILVNNAGIVIGGPLEEMTVEHADRLWAVDVRAVFAATQAAARHMSEGGRIITIGSALAERVPVPGLTLYTMVKSALTGLTKGLARDLGAAGDHRHRGARRPDRHRHEPGQRAGCRVPEHRPGTRPLRHRRGHRRDRRPSRRRRRPLHHRHRDHRRRGIRRLMPAPRNHGFPAAPPPAQARILPRGGQAAGKNGPPVGKKLADQPAYAPRT